jgi:hypothetical protein
MLSVKRVKLTLHNFYLLGFTLKSGSRSVTKNRTVRFITFSLHLRRGSLSQMVTSSDIRRARKFERVFRWPRDWGAALSGVESAPVRAARKWLLATGELRRQATV